MKVALCLACGLVISRMAVADDQLHFGIHGQDLTCADTKGLNNAILTNYYAYFSEWSQQDFITAIKWSDGCPADDQSVTDNPELSPVNRRAYLSSIKSIWQDYEERHGQPKKYRIVDQAAAEKLTFTVAGNIVACSDIVALDGAMSADDTNYFNGWTLKDFNSAAAWSDACVTFGWNYYGGSRAQKLRAVENMYMVPENMTTLYSLPGRQAFGYDRSEAMVSPDGKEQYLSWECSSVEGFKEPDATSDENVKEISFDTSPDVRSFYEKSLDMCVTNGLIDSASADEYKRQLDQAQASLQAYTKLKEDKVKKEAAEQLEKEELLKKERQCNESNMARLFSAQEQIVSDNEAIADARQQISYQHKIGNESGYVDKSSLYSSGQAIVDAQSDLKDQWKIYKRLGGKAVSPGQVNHTIKDPCLQVRSVAPSVNKLP